MDTQKLIKEIGDVLWYLNLLSSFVGADLGHCMAVNIDKLRARYPEGHFSSERSLNRAADDV